MEKDIHQIAPKDFPPQLKEIADPPKVLYSRGNVESLYSQTTKKLVVVGSRKYTSYGEDVVNYLIDGLRGHDICIISGLALGIDALAHEAALRNEIVTIAVPGSGIADEVIYPKTNAALAERILSSGGGLINEFDPQQSAAQWSFPKRNRIVAGLADAVLIIEAAEKSGTLITARLATEYNRDLFVVPASIFAPSSYGAHQFIKLGAIPVTTPKDILDHLGLLQEQKQLPILLSTMEEEILEMLNTPTPRDELIEKLSMSASDAETLLSKLEFDGVIEEKLSKIYRT